MRIAMDCVPCLLRQALTAARFVTDDETSHRAALRGAMNELLALTDDVTPADVAAAVHRAVRETVACADPFYHHKEASNRVALSLAETYRRAADQQEDPLRYLLALAAAANVIDVGIKSGIDLQEALNGVVEGAFDFEDYPLFRERLEQVDRVLYLGDNAGEIVFDLLVVERLRAMGKVVTFVVRDGPILNDVTGDDAALVGMDRVAEVISSGCRSPGITLRLAEAAFRRRLERAPLVLSKGQGNYEGLSEILAPVFFVLRAKCDVVARHLGVPLGTVTLRRGGAPFAQESSCGKGRDWV